jgi:hypothetical protein
MAWRSCGYRGIEEVAVISFLLEEKARMEAPALVDSHAEDGLGKFRRTRALPLHTVLFCEHVH